MDFVKYFDTEESLELVKLKIRKKSSSILPTLPLACKRKAEMLRKRKIRRRLYGTVSFDEIMMSQTFRIKFSITLFFPTGKS